jgi:hypothetical protein
MNEIGTFKLYSEHLYKLEAGSNLRVKNRATEIDFSFFGVRDGERVV